MNLYWAGRLGKGGGLVDLTLERLFIFPLFGVMTLLLTVISKLTDLPLTTMVIVVLSGILALIGSYSLADKYFTDEKREEIIKTYEKPGRTKYFILLLMIMGGLGLTIASVRIAQAVL